MKTPPERTPLKSDRCLNCQAQLTDTFCAHCGQRASTRRFTFRRLFSKEFLSDHLDFDKGLLLTLRSLIVRPGGMIKEYLAGERRKYFNFIGLLLLLLTVEAIIMSIAYHPVSDVTSAAVREQISESEVPEAVLKNIQEGIKLMFSSQKFIFLLIVPLMGLIFRRLFRRTGFHAAEHMVALVFILSMNTLYGLFLALPGLFPIGATTFFIIYQLGGVGILVLDYVAIRWYTKTDAYTRWGGIWRSLAGTFILIMVVSLSLQFTIGMYVGYHMVAGQ